MSFSIRPAKIDDATAIATVQVESWNSTYQGIVPNVFLDTLTVDAQTAQWLAQLGENGPLIHIAEDANGVFGFACGGPLRESWKAYESELYAIYVLQSRQRAGVGRELSRALCAGLYDRGFRSMLVWVLEENPSVAFYKRLGGIEEVHKTITLGGKDLREVAFGWTDLTELT
jgi:L-amino acid N-acyltransferase YncA